ncbi:MAG: hypothetical protein AAFX03_08075 [Pseudomonadota bacterium]
MYDARDPKAAGGRSDLLFGAIVIFVVGLAFVIGMKGPELFGGGADRGVASTPTADDPALAAFQDKKTRRYINALREFDADEYTRLADAVDGATDKMDARLALFEHNEGLLRRHGASLANANARHFDAMLSLGQKALQRASNSGSQFCKGSFYANADRMSPRQLRRLGQDLVDSDELYEFGIDFNILMIEAMEDARTNPANYGEMQPKDQMAIQNMAVSLMSDPQIMSLAMTAQSGDRSALNNVDVCKLGGSVVRAFKKLPQDTKGRIWADAFREGAKSLDQLGLAGF